MFSVGSFGAALSLSWAFSKNDSAQQTVLPAEGEGVLWRKRVGEVVGGGI